MDVSTRQEQVSQAAESRARKLFGGSLLLSVLIIVHVLYQAQRPGGFFAVVRTVMPAVLLWSLTMTTYAFYSLNSIARQRAERLANAFTDLGTGLFNLDYLKSCLEHERKRAVELGSSAAVVYADLVNLERVNQSFGHAVGDIVLKGVSQVIANHVRRGDIVGRVGGDEFLLIMPEAKPAEAEAVVKVVRQAIRDYRLDLGKRGTIDFLNCRMGLAMFPAQGGTPDEIMVAARQKLDDVGAVVRPAPRA
jgi:diguanylate cyclase (GGDEF)-like protein